MALLSSSFTPMFSIPYGKTYEVTFNTVGTFDYATSFEPTRTGQIIVYKK